MSGDSNWVADYEEQKKKVLKKSETTDSIVSTFLPPGVTLDTVRNSKTQIYELDEMIKRNKEHKKSIKESVPPGVVVEEDDEGLPPGMTEHARMIRKSTRHSVDLMEIPSCPAEKEEIEEQQRTRRTKPLRPSVTKQKAKEMFTFMRNQTRRLFEPLRKSGVFRDQTDEMLEMDIHNEMSVREFWITVAAYVGSNALTFFIIWLCAEYVLWA